MTAGTARLKIKRGTLPLPKSWDVLMVLLLLTEFMLADYCLMCKGNFLLLLFLAAFGDVEAAGLQAFYADLLVLACLV